MRTLFLTVGLVFLGGCLTLPKNPKVYEDDNIAIYKVCNPTPIGYVCHSETVNKRATAVIQPAPVGK